MNGVNINTLNENVVFKGLLNISSPISLGLIISSILIGAPSSTILIINAIKNNQISKNEGYNIIYSFSMLSISYSIFILNKFNISILYLIIYILLSIIYFRIIRICLIFYQLLLLLFPLYSLFYRLIYYLSCNLPKAFLSSVYQSGIKNI